MPRIFPLGTEHELVILDSEEGMRWVLRTQASSEEEGSTVLRSAIVADDDRILAQMRNYMVHHVTDEALKVSICIQRAQSALNEMGDRDDTC